MASPASEFPIHELTESLVRSLTPILLKRVIQPRLLTIKHAAVYLGRTEKAIRHLVANCTLPHVKSDTRVMLDRHDLDRWIEQNKISV